MMDFKGTWKTRNGGIAKVHTWDAARGHWEGEIEKDPNDDIGDDYVLWDENGRCLTIVNEVVFDWWDLMERLSERWSKERSGGENG